MLNLFKKKPRPPKLERCARPKDASGYLAICGQCEARLFKTIEDDWKPTHLGACPFGR
jgi:hypothetical protein